MGQPFLGTQYVLEPTIFCPAGGVPAAQSLLVVLAPDCILTDATARTVEARVTSRRAERVMMILDRDLELRAAPGIAAVMARAIAATFGR
jgi:hypothetical protein